MFLYLALADASDGIAECSHYSWPDTNTTDPAAYNLDSSTHLAGETAAPAHGSRKFDCQDGCMHSMSVSTKSG